MKRLVICCDGTWQRLYAGAPTNVALTARAVAPRDAQGRQQIVYYSVGVGASLSGVSLWQGMTGADLDDNLLDAYLFLNLNYEPGDQLYLFGFSRGAYTVRSLAGLVRKCGILRRAHVDKARDALELYRHRDIAADGAEAEHFRTAHAIAWPKLTMPFTDPPFDLRVRYLGVWDTVGALGIPRVLPINIGLNKRYQFHDTALSRSVEFARHAVAIDERRAAFAPTLWSNVDAFNAPKQRTLNSPHLDGGRVANLKSKVALATYDSKASLDLKCDFEFDPGYGSHLRSDALGAPARVAQAWFPGDHGGVGGADVSRGLSNCALMWVVEGAEFAGLNFFREPGSVLSSCLAEIDPINAPLSAKGASLLKLAGARWRRGLDRFGDIHEAARLRWAANPSYRPKILAPFAESITASVRQARAA